MHKELDTISLIPSRRLHGFAAATATIALVVGIATCPAYADGGNPVPQQPAPQAEPQPAPQTTPPLYSKHWRLHERESPYTSAEDDKKKAFALRLEITRDEVRLDKLKEKIAERKEEMEKIQPGSSKFEPIDFHEGRGSGDYPTKGSRLYRLALDNYRNAEAMRILQDKIEVAHAELRDINAE